MAYDSNGRELHKPDFNLFEMAEKREKVFTGITIANPITTSFLAQFLYRDEQLGNFKYGSNSNNNGNVL